MNFTDLTITINAPLIATTGINLAAGVIAKASPDFQVKSFDDTFYKVILQYWYNQECFDNAKAPIGIEGIHEVYDTSEEHETLPLYITGAFEDEIKIDITSETDIDTEAKRKDLIIAKIAERLGLQTTDFS